MKDKIPKRVLELIEKLVAATKEPLALDEEDLRLLAAAVAADDLYRRMNSERNHYETQVLFPAAEKWRSAGSPKRGPVHREYKRKQFTFWLFDTRDAKCWRTSCRLWKLLCKRLSSRVGEVKFPPVIQPPPASPPARLSQDGVGPGHD